MNRQTSASTTAAGSATRPGRAVNVALWVVQVVLAAVFLGASFPKVTLDPAVLEGFAAMGFSGAGTLIIGCLEIAGAIGLLVPRLSGTAALGLVALMIGATIVTVLTMGVASALLPVVLLVLAALVAWGRWYRTVELARWGRRLVTR